MYDNWADVRNQLDQVLACERARRKAQRQQQPSFWSAVRQWLAHALLLKKLRTPSPARAEQPLRKLFER